MVFVCHVRNTTNLHRTHIKKFQHRAHYYNIDRFIVRIIFTNLYTFYDRKVHYTTNKLSI